MKTKASHQSLFSFVFLLIIFLELSNNVWARAKPFDDKYIKYLADDHQYHKGDKVEGLNQIKQYLKNFGYINNENMINTNNDDYYDDVLESAIRKYQSRHGINSTGILNAETLSQMSKPRCGVPDYHYHRHSHHHQSRINTNSKYTFYPGPLKWPGELMNLKYAFLDPTPIEIAAAIENAFAMWSQSSKFTFTRTDDLTTAELKIHYRHIDGPGNKLGFAYAPTGGLVEFDDQESWGFEINGGAIPINTYSIYSLALHEIGHLIGLDHSTIRQASMWPYFDPGETRGLNDDDIRGIQNLYP